jgi:hypothetical protein
VALQTMVNVEQKQINANYLSAFDTGATIQVLSPMNMSNGVFTVGGQEVSGGGGGTFLSNGTTSVLTTTSSIVMNVGASTIMTLTNDAVFSGNVYAQQFITLSDSGVKSNIRAFEGTVLEGVMRLEPKRFEYTSSQGEEIGLLAQDLEAIFPECVKGGADGKKYVNYQALTVILIKAVQELAGKFV